MISRRDSKTSRSEPALSHLSPATCEDPETLVRILRDRYRSGQLCIRCTDSLVLAFRPHQALKEPVDGGSLTQSSSGSRLPVGMGIAARTPYYRLLEESASQSIVISGERGTGKSLVAQAILQELGRLLEPKRDLTSGDKTIMQRVQSARTVLRAFGNAATAEHTDSTLTASYVSLQIDASGRITRALLALPLMQAERIFSRPPKEGGARRSDERRNRRHAPRAALAQSWPLAPNL